MQTLSSEDSSKYDRLCKLYCELKSAGKTRDAARIANAINRLGMPAPDVFAGKIIDFNCLVIG